MNRRFWQRWLRKLPLPLRFSIPATLLLLSCVLGVASFRYEVALAYRRVETDGYYQARFSGSSTSGILTYFYRNNDIAGARLAVGQLGGNINLRLGLLLDEQDQVMASTQYSLKSQRLTNTPAAAQQSTIARVRRSQSGLVTFSPDRRSVQAIYPVLLGITPGELRPSRVGILWLNYDLSQAKAQAIQAAVRRAIVTNLGLLVAIGLLWFLAEQVLTRRANRLVSASHRLAKGELHIRTQLRGSDELAEISRAFDHMAAQIESKTNALRANQAELEAAHITATQKARQLEQTLKELQQAQIQLIQTEKMSSLGQLVAGIAHEINNPVNFIYGNLVHIEEYSATLLELIESYQRNYPKPASELAQFIDNNDIPFLIEDLPKIIYSMRIGTDRIRQIVLSLRNFSRLDEAEMKTVDLHEGLDSTLLILQNRLKGKGGQSQIEVVKQYGHFPGSSVIPASSIKCL
ncbi:sensor histidine kinase [Trichothermofontia sp.]